MGNFIGTFITADDAIMPGHIVTQTGASQKVVAWPDDVDDVSLGVVGCSPSNDVDTAYAVGSSVPVYYCGSGASVWVRFKTNGGALVAGSTVSSDGANVNGLAILAADGTDILFETIGRCTHWHDQVASESWVKVRLG